ncbi:hypothetical protein H696_01843 [Fonticula alba]|uniref:Rab-GAP TBC domain-containing protein n=1 Tax=Fonticula alba TaxID=691883 RepID=A0A058Z9V4_FONAL|nr:hypothetical protein H696_01843 [Fonticula alba]KCV70896.1 hypothetical protein H696_01843 [Fonticula alba]|eukprot:XP_009494019.1 hypothetical protein H696_01843 [Fonticula alba]
MTPLEDAPGGAAPADTSPDASPRASASASATTAPGPDLLCEYNCSRLNSGPAWVEWLLSVPAGPGDLLAGQANNPGSDHAQFDLFPFGSSFPSYPAILPVRSAATRRLSRYRGDYALALVPAGGAEAGSGTSPPTTPGLPAPGPRFRRLVAPPGVWLERFLELARGDTGSRSVGIPEDIRALAWYSLSGSGKRRSHWYRGRLAEFHTAMRAARAAGPDFEAAFLEATRTQTEPTLFSTLLSTPAPGGRELEQDVEVPESIDRDIRRIRTNSYFDRRIGDNLSAISQVLQAYARYDRFTGYCQGMVYLACFSFAVFATPSIFDSLAPQGSGLSTSSSLASLDRLSISDPPGSPGPSDADPAALFRPVSENDRLCERTLWFFIGLMDNLGIKRLYDPSSPDMHSLLLRIDLRISKSMPQLHAHFVENSIISLLYALESVQTLFVSTLSPRACARVWDRILCEYAISGILSGMPAGQSPAAGSGGVSAAGAQQRRASAPVQRAASSPGLGGGGGRNSTSSSPPPPRHGTPGPLFDRPTRRPRTAVTPPLPPTAAPHLAADSPSPSDSLLLGRQSLDIRPPTSDPGYCEDTLTPLFSEAELSARAIRDDLEDDLALEANRCLPPERIAMRWIVDVVEAIVFIFKDQLQKMQIDEIRDFLRAALTGDSRMITDALLVGGVMPDGTRVIQQEQALLFRAIHLLRQGRRRRRRRGGIFGRLLFGHPTAEAQAAASQAAAASLVVGPPAPALLADSRSHSAPAGGTMGTGPGASADGASLLDDGDESLHADLLAYTFALAADGPAPAGADGGPAPRQDRPAGGGPLGMVVDRLLRSQQSLASVGPASMDESPSPAQQAASSESCRMM